MKNTTTPPAQTFTRKDTHQQVTDTIIQQLEAGTVPWHQPWKGDNNRSLSIPQNFTTGNKYRGINIVLLWGSALKNDFPVQEWASFKQWQDKKESVRKGEKGSVIVYSDTFEKEVDGELKKIPFLKSSVVFNRCQLASYSAPEKQDDTPAALPLVERIDTVEEFICNTKAVVQHEGDRAFYRPSEDKIVMPFTEYFMDTKTCTATEGYYSTLMHELTHWTGNTQRLNRTGGKKFGDENYATEELVAELGAAFLCAEFEITTLTKPNHASYIASWLTALKDDKYCILTAASEASKAVAYLQKLQPES